MLQPVVPNNGVRPEHSRSCSSPSNVQPGCSGTVCSPVTAAGGSRSTDGGSASGPPLLRTSRPPVPVGGVGMVGHPNQDVRHGLQSSPPIAFLGPGVQAGCGPWFGAVPMPGVSPFPSAHVLPPGCALPVFQPAPFGPGVFARHGAEAASSWVPSPIVPGAPAFHGQHPRFFGYGSSTASLALTSAGYAPQAGLPLQFGAPRNPYSSSTFQSLLLHVTNNEPNFVALNPNLTSSTEAPGQSSSAHMVVGQHPMPSFHDNENDSCSQSSVAVPQTSKDTGPAITLVARSATKPKSRSFPKKVSAQTKEPTSKSNNNVPDMAQDDSSNADCHVGIQLSVTGKDGGRQHDQLNFNLSSRTESPGECRDADIVVDRLPVTSSHDNENRHPCSQSSVGASQISKDTGPSSSTFPACVSKPKGRGFPKKISAQTKDSISNFTDKGPEMPHHARPNADWDVGLELTVGDEDAGGQCDTGPLSQARGLAGCDSVELADDEELVPDDEEAELNELGIRDAVDDWSDADDVSDNEDLDEMQHVLAPELDVDEESGGDSDNEELLEVGADGATEGADLGYEMHSSILGDCGCAPGNSTYKKRRRWPKGVVPPDCRRPRGMGAIEKAMRNSKNRTTTHIFEPVLGMVFDSRAEAYQFYNLYSWEVGFGIRFSCSSRNRGNKYRTMQQLVCEKEGYDDRCTASSKRDHCKAMIRMHRTEDHGWYISRFVSEHNHPLSESCGEKREWNSHSKIEQCTKDMIRYLRENNVTLSRVHCIMGSLFGSMEDIPFNQKSLRAVCTQIAKDQRDDDVMKTLRLFRKMRKEDPGFQWSVDYDDEKKIKTLIWISGKSRSQWNHFGDVVTFDTTYCTNLYKMPFAMFVGVNNHFQSVVFAGALMRDETAISFKWVFNEFITLVGGKHPMTILTDQCKAMAKAIRLVLPDTKHLWCKWHVLKSAPEELGPVYRVHSPFRKEFHYIINEMLTEDEFERAWDDLLTRHKLHGHPFMEKTYKKRMMWAKPWTKNTYCARMTSTQRSESANSILKKLVPRNSSMNRFVDQYRKLLFMRSSAEYKAVHQTKQFQYRQKRIYPVEKHAFQIYTKRAFMLFKEEIDKSARYHVEKINNSQYLVVHSNDQQRRHWARGMFEVKVLDGGETYICECGLYGHFGMLCCHALKVIIHNGVNIIPEAHIMKRWTRLAQDTIYPDVNPSTDDSEVTSQLFQSLLYGDTLELVQKAKNDREIRDIVVRSVKNCKQEIDTLMEWRSKQPGFVEGPSVASPGFFDTQNSATSESDCPVGNSYGAAGSSAYLSDSDIESIRPPDARRPKGRPKANRFRSPRENKSKSKKKKTLPDIHEDYYCDHCRMPGHNTDACAHVKKKGARGKKKRSLTDIHEDYYCDRCKETGHTMDACSAVTKKGARGKKKGRKIPNT